MDTAAVKQFLTTHADRLACQMGLSHWKIQWKFDYLNGDFAECSKDVDYDQATITVDPSRHETESELLDTIKHELCHLVLAPIDIFEEYVAAGRDVSAKHDRVFTHAVERAVINVQKLITGLK